MGTREELERTIRELVEAANWPDLVTRLLAYTRAYLANYGESEGRRWQNVTESYVQTAVGKVLGFECDDGHRSAGETLFRLLCAVVSQLIDDDELKLKQILEATEWEDIIPRVIAHTVRRLGPGTNRYGKGPEDYVYQAIELLLTRHRHFPHDRVGLFTFLCNTVHSLHTHDAEKIATEGQHLAVTSGKIREARVDEKDESRLTAPEHHDDSGAAATANDFLLSLDDEKLREYARLRALGAYDTAKEYAAALGVTEQTIRNYDRKLKRRRDRWVVR
jgi:hypothetical protein